MKTSDGSSIINRLGNDLKKAEILSHDDKGRLPGGMTVQEAVFHTEQWWEKSGRFQMPDFGKTDPEQTIKSPVLRGLPWGELGRKDKLSVVKHWYNNWGRPAMVMGEKPQ